MANLVQRGGAVHIRVGGNTQETATMVPLGSLPNNTIMSKDYGSTSNPVPFYLLIHVCVYPPPS